MAEEATQAPEGTQDTPTEVSAPPEDTREATAPETTDTAEETAQEIDYAKRYNDLRPEYDRTTAELKEAKQAQQVIAALQSDDPQERAWAADILGLELEDEGDTPDEEGEDQFRDPRVDQILEEKQREQHEKQIAELEDHIDTTMESLAKADKTPLEESEKEWIFARTLSLPPDEQGRPPVEKAYKEYRAVQDTWIKRYRESKRDAPTPPVPGQSGSTQVDLSDRKSRLARANEVAQRALMREQ